MRLHPGEVAATGWRVETLSDVLQRLRGAAPDVAGRPLLVAVDGRGGAGKSTLVERLRADRPRVRGRAHRRHRLEPRVLRLGRPDGREHPAAPPPGRGVEFRPPAWIEHDRPGAIRIPAGADIVWVEGTGIIREEFAPWIDASIWMQGDLDEQERRLVARDGDSAAQQHHIAGWLAEELPLMLREQPWQKATIVVAGTPELDHDPDTEIVVASPAAP